MIKWIVCVKQNDIKFGTKRIFSYKSTKEVIVLGISTQLLARNAVIAVIQNFEVTTPLVRGGVDTGLGCSARR